MGKCIQQGSVLWVLRVALKLNESLSHCVGEARPSRGRARGWRVRWAVVRPKSKESWQKRIQEWRMAQTSQQRHNPDKGETLQVREELRLVIPHPKHVEEFLGGLTFLGRVFPVSVLCWLQASFRGMPKNLVFRKPADCRAWRCQGAQSLGFRSACKPGARWLRRQSDGL